MDKISTPNDDDKNRQIADMLAAFNLMYPGYKILVYFMESDLTLATLYCIFILPVCLFSIRYLFLKKTYLMKSMAIYSIFILVFAFLLDIQKGFGVLFSLTTFAFPIMYLYRNRRKETEKSSA